MQATCNNAFTSTLQRIVPLSAGKAGAYAHKKRPVAGGGKSKVRTPSIGESPPPLLNPDGTAALVSANGKKLKEDVIEVVLWLLYSLDTNHFGKPNFACL